MKWYTARATDTEGHTFECHHRHKSPESASACKWTPIRYMVEKRGATVVPQMQWVIPLEVFGPDARFLS
jgi:hypothetical protein